MNARYTLYIDRNDTHFTRSWSQPFKLYDTRSQLVTKWFSVLESRRWKNFFTESRVTGNILSSYCKTPSVTSHTFNTIEEIKDYIDKLVLLSELKS